MRKRIGCLLLLLVLSLLTGGCRVPGVDYPINESAFWDPDRPDYADDGNVYSRKMLSSGTVFDHSRFLQNTAYYINDLTVTQNQELNLRKLGTVLTGLTPRYIQLKNTSDQDKGLLKSNSSWNDFFHPLVKLENGNTVMDMETVVKENNQTYQDSLRKAATNIQSEYIKTMIDQVYSQNVEVVGNNQAKQNTNQGYSTKVIQEMGNNQNNASILSTLITREGTKQQTEAEAYQNAKGFNVKVTDPYNDTNVNREQGRGFFKL